jgi:hypothetical protein
MGVISAVGVLTAANWAGSKPADYKGAELDKALQAWEALAGKAVQIPQDLIPTPPACKVGALTNYVNELKSVVKELERGKALVMQYVTALQAVQAAGSKASADLIKLSKGKKLDEATQQKYTYAANAANSIAASAAGALKDYQ